MNIIVAIDCMGGDHGPGVTLPAALEIVAREPEIGVVLVGPRDAMEDGLRRLGASPGERVRVQHASQVVNTDESVADALRKKKDSSMRVAVNLVKNGEAHACVSAGNTGALMAISRFVLKTLPGIDRPALCSVLPTMRGETYMLDLGANVDCTPGNLLQFGVMGAMLVSAVEHRERPSVGLLNIGVEDIKGNVEGDDIFRGTTDIVVCDGFVGNVALKASEGVAQMISHVLREEFSRNLVRKLAALVARPAINAFRSRMDHRRYSGASLLGLRGIVVKSHGSSDTYAFGQAIGRAVEEVRNDVVERIGRRMAQLHPHSLGVKGAVAGE